MEIVKKDGESRFNKEQILKPGQQMPQPANVRLNATEMPDLLCNCGSRFFRQVTLIKKVSALVSPTGQEQLAPIVIFRCDDCGEVPEDFVAAFGNNIKPNN